MVLNRVLRQDPSDPKGDRSRPSPIRIVTLHDQVTGRLRDKIVEGELVDGARIPEKEICEELGVSRTPLREALKVLAAEQLVTLLPNRGAVVTKLTSEVLADKVEVVAGLEALAARLVCERADDAQIRALSAYHDKLVTYFTKRDRLRYFKANQDFHQAIVEAAGNPVLRDLHGGLLAHLRRARYRGMQLTSADSRFVAEHESLMRAIAARDGSAAQEAAFEHMRNVGKLIDVALRDASNPETIARSAARAARKGVA